MNVRSRLLTLTYPLASKAGWAKKIVCYPMFSLAGHKLCTVSTYPMFNSAGQIGQLVLLTYCLHERAGGTGVGGACAAQRWCSLGQGH